MIQFLIKQFVKQFGRQPNFNELLQLAKKSDSKQVKDNVIKFPEGGRDSVPVTKQFDGEGITSLDEFTASEDAYEAAQNLTKKFKDNRLSKFLDFDANQASEEAVKVIKREGMYKNLSEDKSKSILDMLDDIITKSDDVDPFADGGRVGFKIGGLSKLLLSMQNKLGKKNITTADKVGRPQSALDKEMFDEANKRFNKKVNERTSAAEVGIDDLFNKDGVLDTDAVLSDITNSVAKTKKSKIVKTKTPNKALLKAMDEVGGGTGDLKYDADVLADEYAFQLGLIEEGGDITDIADQMKRMDLYDEAYSALSGQFLKNREIKKMQQFSEPTQTLKSIKDKGAIDISDPTIADEFDRFLRKNDPEGYKNLEQKIQLDNFDPKGRKKNAIGGLAGVLKI